MQFLIWSGTFLLITIGSSAVELIGMLGLPIAPDVHIGVATLAALVVATGTAMMLLARPASLPIAQAQAID